MEPELFSWQIAHIEKGLEQLRRGETVSHDKVAQWLGLWGSDNEGDPPR